VTDAPRLASSNAHAAPMIPPPTTTTSGTQAGYRLNPSVESCAETWLSGRKQPPAKRLGG
jgi:hypothetical protein